MKPKAPKKQPPPAETAAVLTAWLALVVAATTANYQAASEPIPFALPLRGGS